MSEYLGKEAVGAHEARIEALSKMFEDEELQTKEMSAAMQEIDSRIFTHRFYHEAPHDVFELIFPHFSDVDENGEGNGGLNVMRLVSKRCMRVSESVATRLTALGTEKSFLLPLALKRCKRIEHIRCKSINSYKIKSLEGCPDRLKSLYVGAGTSLENLEPLLKCTNLESLEIINANKDITDLSPLNACTRLVKLSLSLNTGPSEPRLSPLSSMPLLKNLEIFRAINSQGIVSEDLAPLAACKRLKNMVLRVQVTDSDLIHLSSLSLLEELTIEVAPSASISRLSEFVTSNKLRVLHIHTTNTALSNISFLSENKELEELYLHYPVGDLGPLSRLKSLSKVSCLESRISLLPLAEIKSLRVVYGKIYNVDEIQLLQKKRWDVQWRCERQ